MFKCAVLAAVCTMVPSCEKSIVIDYQRGCISGIPKDGSTHGRRVFIKCDTHLHYIAGGNVDAGGSKDALNYDSRRWDHEEDCNKCLTKSY